MSMELTSDRIASNSLFAFANGDHYLEVGDLAWSYHVAPLLGVSLFLDGADGLFLPGAVPAGRRRRAAVPPRLTLSHNFD